ncbi:MAG: hypothetical protein JWO44_1202 [Bacteroidetes bacterium]|nr:hypothetical protein [Bacteroidota bacterium]
MRTLLSLFLVLTVQLSFSQVSSDSLLLLQKKPSLDSTKASALPFLRKQLKAIRPHGSISAGYEYGVLPFVADGNFPSGGYKTEGRVSFLLMSVPLELMYYYTSIKNVVGLNNYFRISYDADRYKEQLSEKLSARSKAAKDKVSGLQLQQQRIMQKMEYLKFLEKYPDYRPPSTDSLRQAPGSGSMSIPDSSQIPAASIPGSAPDSSAIPKVPGYTYSGDQNNRYAGKKDSIAAEISRYQAQYDSVSTEIRGLQQQMAQIENLQNNRSIPANPYLSKLQNILSTVKKFEIGLCHPDYSTFLVNNIPLQGINIEFARNDNFLALTYGTTINNLLFNPNTLQGSIQGARNLYNYFDFGNIEAGRKIVSVKGGLGGRDETHLYAGFLLAKGRTDYLHLSGPDHLLHGPEKESNLVVELDAKYRFNPQLSIDLVFGKSSVKEEDLSMEQVRKCVNELFSAYRSYAVLSRMNLALPGTKTKLTFTVRWVDPYFKSFGLGFLRSDNLRYEAKAEQVLSKKVKYTLAYRREEDNLLKLYDYKNVLQSISNTLNIKFNRSLNVRLIYTPLFRELRSGADVLKDRNTISTAVVSYTPRAKKINVQFNALYSRYIISGDSSQVNFENVTYTHQFSFRSGFKTDLNVSWFKNNISDTLGNDTYLSVLDIGYTTKNNSGFVIGGKAAYKKGMKPQYGFVVKATIKLYKGLSWDTEMEKIIIGDYYNSFMIEKIRQFPYYCSTKLTVNF